MIRGKRTSGILLHITSLPSNYGIGDLGPESYQFAELLSRCKQRYWSILPLNPTTIKRENSPYVTESVFAGNTLIISPDMLAQEGFIHKDYLKPKKHLPKQKVNYREAQTIKKAVLKKAYRNYKTNSNRREDDFNDFCSQEDDWLEDYAFYKALRNKSRKPWYSWPDLLRNREPKTLAQKTKSLSEAIQYEKFAQYIFYKQWNSLRDYSKHKEVRIIGDLPFYLDYDSADVWSHPELYELDLQKKPRYVSGVPPDYFSKTGQLWGNPIYNWKKHEETCFEWWIKRIKHNLRFCDALRLDHFRGFIAYWQVPAFAKTAEKGMWIETPKSFLQTLKKNFPSLPL
jgi:4-alpha-glucanotransferase